MASVRALLQSACCCGIFLGEFMVLLANILCKQCWVKHVRNDVLYWIT